MARQTILLVTVLITILACSGKKDHDNDVENITDTISRSYNITSYSDGWDTLSYPRQPHSWFQIRRQETLSLEGYQLVFQEASVDFEPYYVDDEERKTASERYISPYEKALAVELYLRDKSESPFQRLGDTLSISNGQQPPWQLVNSPSQKYSVENYFPEKGLLLVKVFYKVGTSHLLVDVASGRSIYLWGQPYFSPQGDLMISINNDQQTQYGANGIQLFEIREDSLKPLWELGIANWGPLEAMWTDSQALLIKREYPADNESEEVYITDEVLLILQDRESQAF